jgi:hypothetical protein
MRKYAISLSCLLAAESGAGMFFRIRQLRAGFEPDSGLPVRGAPTTTLLLIYTAVFIACALVLALYVRRRLDLPDTYARARAPFGNPALIISAALGLALLAAAVFFAANVSTASGVSMTRAAQSLLCALTALALPALELTGRKTRPAGAAALVFSLVPELFCTLWLVEMYRQNQTNPVLLTFVFQTLAVVCAAMSFYYTAGWVFGKPSPARTVFFHTLAVFFCAVSLADALPTHEKFVLAAFLVFLFLSFLRFTQNLTLRAPIADKPTAAPAVEP